MDSLNYGVIGNCRSAALVSDTGDIEWCCLPDFDSPSVFARLLDRQQGGYFGFETDASYAITQKYIRQTNILCTQFCSPEGSFEVFDFMPRYKTSDNNYYTPAEVYRYIRRIAGKPEFRVIYRPAFNYARETAAHITDNDHIRTYSVDRPIDCLYLYSSIGAREILEETPVTLDDTHFLLLSYNQKLIPVDIQRVYLEYTRTKTYWLNWSNRSKKFDLYQDQITRSLLVLKIMSYQPTGAVLAALTTSLPETIGEVRNWDYRFCWLRDASMSIDTLLNMGYYKSAQSFLSFIKRILVTKHDSFQIMYGIRGERQLTEESLNHLEGYMESKPVRIGNAAYHQRQNDVFGYMLHVILQYYQYFPGTLDEIEDMWEIVRNIARTVTTHWELPDKGIWEIRNEEKHFVFSKVMSWVALDRAVKIARLLNQTAHAETWEQVADDIRDEVNRKGWDPQLRTFTQTYGDPQVDASLLLMAEYGFIDAADPKFRGTVLAIKTSLFYRGLMYRYINDDDFGRPTSSFTICTFWLVQALHAIGLEEEARKVFDDLLACGNHLGLFSEDIHFETKRLLGNFPQAYSHLALINTACLFANEKKVSKFIRP